MPGAVRETSLKISPIEINKFKGRFSGDANAFPILKDAKPKTRIRVTIEVDIDSINIHEESHMVAGDITDVQMPQTVEKDGEA